MTHKKLWIISLLTVYVLVNQGKNQPVSKQYYEGMTQAIVEKMLKTRKVKYRIVTQAEFNATKQGDLPK